MSGNEAFCSCIYLPVINFLREISMLSRILFNIVAVPAAFVVVAAIVLGVGGVINELVDGDTFKKSAHPNN